MAAPVITIFKNGDNHFQGKRLVVNRKEIRNFESLLDKITKDTRSQIAVRSLRTPNHGHRVNDVEKLENGGIYVAVGQERFKKLRYNEIRALPVHRQKVEGQIIKPVVHSRVLVSGRARKVAAAEPLSNRIIQVHRNGDDRNGSIKILLDKRTLKSMENVLQYISDKVNLRTGAVRSLYSIDGVIVENANQIESGQKYVAVGFGKRFLKVNYHDGGSHSLTPRRAATKNSYSPARSLKRIKPRRLKTHPQDIETMKRENKLPSLGGSESPVKYPKDVSRLPSKESEVYSPQHESTTFDSPIVSNTPGSRKNSSGSKSPEVKGKSDPFHSPLQKENTFELSPNEGGDVDAAAVVDDEEKTAEDNSADIFKATGIQSEKAKAVRDDDGTQTEKPIDMQVAEEVEEQLEENNEETARKDEEDSGKPVLLDNDEPKAEGQDEPTESYDVERSEDATETTPRKASTGSLYQTSPDINNNTERRESVADKDSATKVSST